VGGACYSPIGHVGGSGRGQQSPLVTWTGGGGANKPHWSRDQKWAGPAKSHWSRDRKWAEPANPHYIYSRNSSIFSNCTAQVYKKRLQQLIWCFPCDILPFLQILQKDLRHVFIPSTRPVFFCRRVNTLTQQKEVYSIVYTKFTSVKYSSSSLSLLCNSVSMFDVFFTSPNHIFYSYCLDSRDWFLRIGMRPRDWSVSCLCTHQSQLSQTLSFIKWRLLLLLHQSCKAFCTSCNTRAALTV
jgi:hypothetical protein